MYLKGKEPCLGPAVNSATSNLDPPIDTGSKEGLKDTITSNIVNELSKKAYTIPDDRISNFLENPNISNTYSNSDQGVLLILLRNGLSSSPRAAISVRYYDSGGCLIKNTLYRGDGRYIAILDFKKSGFFLNVKGSSKPILYANSAFPLGLTSYNTTKSIELQRNKIVVEIPSNSIRKEDYRPIIEDTIVSEAIEPNKRYKLRNYLAKGTTLEAAGPSLRGKRPSRPVEPLATT
ncbi:hypothetical protein P8C59_001651 [Phyllachora maydis]|uniref:Uncharacterized protein n=1 Tax=Phyllachora maydis TaxID=1825666 RepID=A0AAD9M9E2_9PEZI|nr:hypothetical protein P8C59_001651 [Phyllachora maydis]